MKLDFTYLKGKKGSYFWDNIRQKWPLWLKDTRMNCNLQTTNEKKMRLVLISHDGLLFNSMAIVYLKQNWCCRLLRFLEGRLDFKAIFFSRITVTCAVSYLSHFIEKLLENIPIFCQEKRRKIWVLLIFEGNKKVNSPWKLFLWTKIGWVMFIK